MWTVAIIAAVTMLLQDVFGVVMLQMESNSLSLPPRRTWRDYVGGGWKAWGGAVLDQLSWMVGITTTTISVQAFTGHSFTKKVIVFCFISAANIIGSRMGQEMGIWMLRRKGKSAATLSTRVDLLEQRLNAMAVAEHR